MKQKVVACFFMHGAFVVSLLFTVSQSLFANELKSISDKHLQDEASRQRFMLGEQLNKADDRQLKQWEDKPFDLTFSKESPCFDILHITLDNAASFANRAYYQAPLLQAKGCCLGGAGIKQLMDVIQNRLIKDGFITTRVVAPEQDLTQGKLKLLIVKGTLGQIRYKEDSDDWALLSAAMPASQGKLLNIRDVEQGLDNLHKLPGVSASMQIMPGKEVGESDIEIAREQKKYFRVSASLSDTGTKETGLYQGGLTFNLDNALRLSDTFSLTLGKDLHNESRYNTYNYALSYAVHFRYFNVNFSNSYNHYLQTVAGISHYKYSGESMTSNFNIGYVLHRNQTQKTSLDYGVTHKRSKNYVNDVEVEVQGRKTSYWILSLNHQNRIRKVSLDAGLTYKKGVRWFNAEKAPEEYGGYGSALTDILNVNASLSFPFAIGALEFNYKATFQGQLSLGEVLTPPDRFSIGGRYSVRGFDGNLSLSADSGYYIKNELSLNALKQNKLYLALDYGQVNNDDDRLIGDKLLGTVLGIRGSLYKLSYDVFAGAPIYKPKGFKTSNVVVGFNLNWNE